MEENDGLSKGPQGTSSTALHISLQDKQTN